MTRISFLTCCIALLSLQSFGELSLGINLTSDLSVQHWQENRNNESSTNSYSMDIYPQLLIPAADIMEIAPFAGFSFSRSVSYQNDDQNSESSLFGFNLGSGLYFRIAENDVIRFSIGPEIYCGMRFISDSDEYYFSTGINGPANIDLMITPRFFVRLSPHLIEMPFEYHSEDDDRNDNSFAFKIITQTSSSLGFFFTF